MTFPYVSYAGQNPIAMNPAGQLSSQGILGSALGGVAGGFSPFGMNPQAQQQVLAQLQQQALAQAAQQQAFGAGPGIQGVSQFINPSSQQIPFASQGYLGGISGVGGMGSIGALGNAVGQLSQFGIGQQGQQQVVAQIAQQQAAQHQALAQAALQQAAHHQAQAQVAQQQANQCQSLSQQQQGAAGISGISPQAQQQALMQAVQQQALAQAQQQQAMQPSFGGYAGGIQASPYIGLSQLGQQGSVGQQGWAGAGGVLGGAGGIWGQVPQSLGAGQQQSALH